MAHREDLIQLELKSASNPHEGAANGAPVGEPDVWAPNIAEFNPHLSHIPEPYPVAVSPEFAQAEFNVEEYLADERAKDLLRFSTAGSVDDGKSTLIGRLLYDTQSVYDDQIKSIEGKGTTAPGVLDLALLTDGLRAEREQGITIDVAYRYFSTPRRKFIIADTPGHEQYTRNMATGASTADVAIVLIDARKGVLTQSRRHAYITALLGVRHIIIAINKMDLVAYSESLFSQIKQDFSAFFRALDVDGNDATALHFVPVSALAGDNVVHSSSAMPWYCGPTLLSLLEELPASHEQATGDFRFAVQRVIRPNLDFRGFAGQITSGSIRPGDRIVVLPSGQSSRVERIVTFDGDLPHASAPLSVTLTLANEIDISRGDLLVRDEARATATTSFLASLVWMDATPLQPGRRYLLKQTSCTVHASVRALRKTINLAQLQATGSAAALAVNGIGEVDIETTQPVVVDVYAANRHTGSFVLIDPQTNATVAAGMIRQITGVASNTAPIATTDAAPVTVEHRALRYGHSGAHLGLPGSLAAAVERAIFDRGGLALRWPGAGDAAIAHLVSLGVIVLTEIRDEQGLFMNGHPFTNGQVITAAQTIDALVEAGILHKGEAQ